MKALLSGNEAIARGAYEAGVIFASAYPGTPSTEILEAIAHYDEIQAQWAPNEKVALETAAGASLAGGRALVAMKHVGLNVAADPLFSLVYMGCPGGLVIVSADDPGMHSSQNEQDNRWYARAAKLPMLEPSDSQEARIFTKLAFEISEKYNTPVLLRITTRIAHSSSVVTLEPRAEHPIPPYQKNSEHHVLLPVHARKIHPEIEARLQRLSRDAVMQKCTTILRGNSDVGIITAGVAFHYACEVFPEASFFKLGMTHPMPVDWLFEFALSVRNIFVIEELDPFLEEQIRALGIEVTGKDRFPVVGELNPDRVRQGLYGPETEKKEHSHEPVSDEIPPRPPVFCPGCPHAGMFWALKKLRFRVTGDIGCYTLGALPPLAAMDSCLNMGASIGMAEGMERVLKDSRHPVAAVIGDSTFIHSGITGLIDLVYNGSHAVVVILDNGTTAMTGHQPHPGTGRTLKGHSTHKLDIEQLCRALGVPHVEIVNPYHLDDVIQALKRAKSAGELSVIISRAPCILLEKRRLGAPLVIDMNLCKACNVCLQLGCPAIERVGQQYRIDPAFCVGCGLCARGCQLRAIVSSDDMMIMN
ncbi:MAG: indolepyruvate ferredoxin oxidoreductase subunit alpha [candidate division KSB1 bacterium]|nr:indolepyruvate ferredoxin oxidoreductase subunit alpha [candidate division KSB1 bacterium]